jgi:predicted transcriptional regulator
MLYNSEGDTLNDEERAALHQTLLRGIAQADAGQLIDADEVLAELDSPS